MVHGNSFPFLIARRYPHINVPSIHLLAATVFFHLTLKNQDKSHKDPPGDYLITLENKSHNLMKKQQLIKAPRHTLRYISM
ncbi:hypothetical protein, partial [Serratia marcescens]|uniref:hypothetical protein n=1 Tax=Serratia marcescens TaxID=615 RepID=UPI002AA0DCD7